MSPVDPSSSASQTMREFFASQVERIQAHLKQAGKMKTPKSRPRVFVAVHHVNWEKHGMVDAWAEIADIIHYDWGDQYDQFASDWHEKGKPALSKELPRRVKEAHKKEPIDLFFSYLSGRWVFPQTIHQIGQLGIPTVNISFDDKIKFYGFREASGFSGNAEVAPAFDFNVTSQAAADVHQYAKVDARAVFLPPGGNPMAFSPLLMERDIPVSFIGQCYGMRPRIINWLQERGVPVQAYGKGWPTAEISLERMNEIYSRSLINIGFGFIGDSSNLIGLKGRDFEVPLAGGLYLTTFNPELAACFEAGKEIDFYRSENDLLQKIQYYTANPEIAKQIGAAGRERSLRSHTWRKRFETILSIAGLL